VQSGGSSEYQELDQSVALDVGVDIILGAHELARFQRLDVVELQTGLAPFEDIERDFCPLTVRTLLKRSVFLGREHAVQAAQYGERQG
jgi:hypothetical protein